MNNPNQSQTRQSFSGIVERVFEDGFFLNTGDRSIEVDSWDLYRDSTRRYVSSGQQLSVFGEFEGGEFDAFSISFGDSGSVPGNNGSPNNNPGFSRDGDDLMGNNGNNVLRGTNRSDDIFGLGGNDRLIGRGGNDDLFGGDGNDILRGGSGNDDLIGGAGQDILIGNGGRDTFVLQPGGNDIIRDFQDQIDEIGLSGGLRFNNLDIQQQGNDTLILSGGSRVALMLGVNASSITIADLD